MKTRPLLAILILALSLVLVRAAAAQNPAPTPPRISPERVELKVLQVFAADDDGHFHRSYLVEYKGHPVIVEDTLVKTNYREGDTITVLVMKHPHPDKSITTGLMRFSVVTPPRKR